MPHSIALITDSTCDIPADWREQYEITVIPLVINFGDESYLDGVDMTAEQFYQRLPHDPHHPTTSQAAPQGFLDAYQRAAEHGAQEVLAIILSSAQSGTIEAARQAAQDASIPVHVFDSLNNSMGMGWQVIAAARAREAGGGLEAMLAAAEQVRKKVAYYISLDTIEYLARGGRIGTAARLVESVLHIKPLVYVRPDTGTVASSVPSRSRKAAIESLYKEFFRQVDTSHPLHITVLHNNTLAEAEELAERVQREYRPVELFISIVSPVLGVHTGPCAIALCGYAE